jgi:hypothetical protein
MFSGGQFYDFLEGSWDQAKGYLREHLEQMKIALDSQWSQVFAKDNTLNFGAIAAPPGIPAGGNVPSYVANTGPNKAPRWDKVDVSVGVKSRLQFAHLIAATVGGVLIGRESGTAGNFEEITPGYALNISGTTLRVSSPTLAARIAMHI